MSEIEELSSSQVTLLHIPSLYQGRGDPAGSLVTANAPDAQPRRHTATALTWRRPVRAGNIQHLHTDTLARGTANQPATNGSVEPSLATRGGSGGGGLRLRQTVPQERELGAHVLVHGGSEGG